MFLRNTLIFAIVMLCFSYVTTTSLALQLGIPTGPLNAAIKGSIALMFLVVLFASDRLNRDDYHRLFPLMFFFLLYSIRMLYDIVVYDVLFTDQSLIYITGFFFGLTMLPTIAVGMRLHVDDIPRLHNWILIALTIANVAVVAYFFGGGTIVAEEAFSGRIQTEGEAAGTTVLNPITISLYGTMLAVFSLGRLTVKRDDGLQMKAFLLFCVVLGFSTLLMGGSRGPLLSFSVNIAIIIFVLLRSLVVRSAIRTQASVWLILGVGAALFVSFVIVQGQSLYLFDRIVDMLVSRSQGGREERDFLWAMAWSDFERAPLFGYSYVTSIGGYHPHNTVLEALMATGAFGGIFIFIAHYLGLRGYWRMLNGSLGPHGFSLALIGICFLVTGLLSGSIGQFPEVWLFLGLAATVGNHQDAAQRRAKFFGTSVLPAPVAR
jgi:O-antigen ligase